MNENPHRLDSELIEILRERKKGMPPPQQDDPVWRRLAYHGLAEHYAIGEISYWRFTNAGNTYRTD